MITTNMKQIIIIFVMILLVSQLSLAQGLKITEIDLNVDYDEAYTYRIEKRDRMDSVSGISNNSKINADIFPGANVTFTLRIENSFPSSGSSLKGVFARITLEEINDGDDLEGESLDFDLEPGDDYRVDVKFQIPLDVDSGTYNAVIEAEGDERNGTTQGANIAAKLEIKRQSHDIRIIRTILEPGAIECERKIRLSAEAMNLGSNPENQIALEFKSEILGISSIDGDIFLESSDEASIEEKTYEKTLNAAISKSLDAGTYPIFVNLYWRNAVVFDKKVIYLKVKDCGAAPTGSEQIGDSEEPVQVIDLGNITGQPLISGEQPSAAGSAKFISTPALMFIVLGAFIAFVLIIVAIFGYGRKQK